MLAACTVYGFSIGKMITFPPLIIQREIGHAAFGAAMGLGTSISGVVSAFGPDRSSRRWRRGAGYRMYSDSRVPLPPNVVLAFRQDDTERAVTSSVADRTPYPNSAASAAATDSALSVTVRSSEVAWTVMFSAKKRARDT
jgi:hypothetical protein